MRKTEEEQFKANFGDSPISHLELLKEHLQDLGDDATPLNRKATIGQAIEALERMREDMALKEELDDILDLKDAKEEIDELLAENAKLRAEIRGLKTLRGN